MKVGIIGAGQLGRMLALAGYPLGLRFVFLDQSEDAPGAQVGRIIPGAFDDKAQLQKLARAVDVITFDVENVPVDAVEEIAAQKPFLPPVAALGASQDRLSEKTLFRQLRIPTPEFKAVDGLADLHHAVESIGLPGVLKTRRLGYDGRGQYYLRTREDIDVAWSTLGSVPLIYEAFVPFEREISIIGARSVNGATKFYPIADNTHAHGILRYSIAPFVNARLQKQAESYLKRVLKHLDYAGILTIEFFVKRGQLIANEMAPRVHNSGHWTIEGAVTSQFENHVRAILGLPLGETRAQGHSAMINFIGTLPEPADLLHIPGLHYHSYDKVPRANRKLGHCTINLPTRAARDQALKKVLKKLAINS